METRLPYSFRRKSKNHLDWLLNIVKSEKYYQAESYIVVTTTIERNQY
jgi:hypothetical protein